MPILLAAMAVLFCGSAGAAEKASSRGSPYYAAIAYHSPSQSVGWATDRRTAREAKTEALRQCAHPNCEVVASVTRGCAALARDSKKFTVKKGVTRAEAETKASRSCGANCEIAAWTCTR